MIRVEPLSASREGEWDSFLGSRPEGLVYCSIRYRDLLLDILDAEPEYLVALDPEDRVHGVLPIMWSGPSGGRRVANALPFYGSNGAPVSDSGEAARALEAAWDERAHDDRTLAATMVSNPLAQEPDVASTMTDTRISQITDLPAAGAQVREELMAAIDSSARRNVRKAERTGFRVERDPEAVGELRRIHEQNMADMGGRAKSPEFFAALRGRLRFGEDADLWVARDGDRVAAALLVLYFGETAEYFTPVTEHDRRSDQPMALILIEAMSHAAERGYRRWNWGGTWKDQEGVYRFKRKWGAAERPYRYLVQLNAPELLERDPTELLEAHPGFFVVPFTALATPGGTR